MPSEPSAIAALEAPQRTKPSNYPEPFRSMMVGRTKRPLGELFGLANFGVNIVTLSPGAVSALRHAHTRQDEFIFIVSGAPTLYTDAGAQLLAPGMCAGFKAGTGDAHRLVNESDHDVVYLEVGDRSAGDEVAYPDDDLVARLQAGEWQYAHKDGTPYA
jgi:uncharacterized cupin superfamily protein